MRVFIVLCCDVVLFLTGCLVHSCCKRGGEGGPCLPPPLLTDQFTLSQLGGGTLFPLRACALPDFQNLRQPCSAKSVVDFDGFFASRARDALGKSTF